MLFVIHAIDRDDGGVLRAQLYDAHRSYLAASPVKRVMSGPMLGEDLTSRIGTLIIIDVANRMEANVFANADPFFQAGLFLQHSLFAFENVLGNAPVKSQVQ